MTNSHLRLEGINTVKVEGSRLCATQIATDASTWTFKTAPYKGEKFGAMSDLELLRRLLCRFVPVTIEGEPEAELVAVLGRFEYKKNNSTYYKYSLQLFPTQGELITVRGNPGIRVPFSSMSKDGVSLEGLGLKTQIFYLPQTPTSLPKMEPPQSYYG